MKISPSVKVDELEKKTTATVTPAQAGANKFSDSSGCSVLPENNIPLMMTSVHDFNPEVRKLPTSTMILKFKPLSIM
jgi:hypothetical protein